MIGDPAFAEASNDNANGLSLFSIVRLLIGGLRRAGIARHSR
jgi:hypothetical protein